MPTTMERVLADDDGDNAARVMAGEAEMYANYGQAPGELAITRLGAAPEMGYLALSRSGLVPGSEYWHG